MLPADAELAHNACRRSARFVQRSHVGEAVCEVVEAKIRRSSASEAAAVPWRTGRSRRPSALPISAQGLDEVEAVDHLPGIRRAAPGTFGIKAMLRTRLLLPNRQTRRRRPRPPGCGSAWPTGTWRGA